MTENEWVIESLDDIRAAKIEKMFADSPSWAEAALWCLYKNGYDFDRYSGDVAYYCKMLAGTTNTPKLGTLEQYHGKIVDILMYNESNRDAASELATIIRDRIKKIHPEIS